MQEDEQRLEGERQTKWGKPPRKERKQPESARRVR